MLKKTIKVTNKKTDDTRIQEGETFDVFMSSPVGGAFVKAQNGDTCYLAPEEFETISISIVE